VVLFEPIRDYIDALVHASARTDARARARHRAFMAPRLLGGLAALIVFPIYLGVRGVPSVLEAVGFVWLIAPIFCAYFLSRTGRFEIAHALSSLSLIGLIVIVAAKSGGIASSAAVWLVVVPLDAALSASRRVVIIVSTITLVGCALLIALSPMDGSGTVAAIGIASATLYAAGLALGAEKLARSSLRMLSAEESKYRLLAHNMSDVITRHDRNAATLFVSPAAASLLGASPSELSGHGLFDRIHVLDRPAYLTALRETSELREDRSVEFRIRREASGAAPQPPHFIWIEMRCRHLDRTSGQAIDADAGEVVGVLRDISDRKAQEQAVEEARKQAEKANIAKGRFLATVSHELRTPLNVIIGFSQMLLDETQLRLDPERRREYANLINDSGSHLLQVVNGILDMSRLDSGEFEIRPEPFALPLVIENCCDLLVLRARDAGIDLSASVRGDLPDIVADKRAMKQILFNLLGNAIKFTDRGGRVVVSAAAEAAMVVITVEDNGIGIGEDDLPRLGDPFFQARSAYDRRHDGTGLGLSIVKGLATLHGGELQIHSRVGEGTRAVVRLPLNCEEAQSASVERALERRTGLNFGQNVGDTRSEPNSEGASMKARKSA
jgi:two-component system, cell cycle sensor histidine kinase DivJ